MTDVIINDILPLTQIIATAGQTIYSTNWTANYPSDVIVYSRPANTPADDATQILAYPNLYSVSFIGGLQTVQVTLVNPSNMGDVVTITRQTPADRENLYTNTNFTPSMLNQDFGILTLVDQQAQLVNQQVGPRYNYSATTTTGVDNILPVLQANQLWVKNSSDTAIVAANINTMSAGSVNLGSAGELAYYATTGTVVSGLASNPSSVLVTDINSNPSFTTTLPSGLSATNMNLTTPTLGVANATSINFGESALSYYQTWTNYTPVLTVSGGTAPTYTELNIARYFRIGNMVTVNIQLANSSGGTAGSGSGQIMMSLPVTAGASAGGGVLNQFGYFINSTTEGMLYSTVRNGFTTIPLYYFNTISTTAQITGDLQNNAIRQIGLYFSYEV